ncbi:hypothetical protein X773_21950 [Mesorhizobium sp. LSJC285A00]|nr:hypothetical protein X773_21950 [Mesorhizobium sp. LSJC285A00]
MIVPEHVWKDISYAEQARQAGHATIKNTHELVAERQSETDESLASDNQHDNLPVTAL